MNSIFTIRQLIVDCFTGIDGESWDPARIGFAITLGQFLLMGAYQVVFTQNPVNYQDFGLGAAAIAAGFGGMIKLKEKTEPPHVPGQDKNQ